MSAAERAIVQGHILSRSELGQSNKVIKLSQPLYISSTNWAVIRISLDCLPRSVLIILHMCSAQHAGEGEGEKTSGITHTKECDSSHVRPLAPVSRDCPERSRTSISCRLLTYHQCNTPHQPACAPALFWCTHAAWPTSYRLLYIDYPHTPKLTPKYISTASGDIVHCWGQINCAGTRHALFPLCVPS